MKGEGCDQADGDEEREGYTLARGERAALSHALDERVNGMFVKTVRAAHLKMGGLLILILAAGAALLIWPQAAAGGVSRGLSICSGVIIPSLVPFLVLAGFLVRSGISAALGRRLEGVTRALFGLPGCCAPGILIGFIGGYPTGGMAVGELVESGQITGEEGRRMLRFCVNGGPAFIISAVGAGMMGSVRFGVVLFTAHLLASLLIGIGGGIGARHRRGEPPACGKKTCIAGKRTSPAAAFVESVNAACRSLLYMCGFVVLFAALLALLDVSGATAAFTRFLTLPFALAGADTGTLSSFLPCLLEVSCGCVEASGTGEAAPLLLGAALGWGGLSVHCQLAASLHGQRLMGRGFFAFRLLHALLGGLLTMVLLRFVPIPVTVWQPSTGALIKPFSGPVVASAALLLMCGMLLLTTAGLRQIRENRK